jgi:CubicO group peptidase (beta-lactamase class C family)
MNGHSLVGVDCPEADVPVSRKIPSDGFSKYQIAGKDAYTLSFGRPRPFGSISRGATRLLLATALLALGLLGDQASAAGAMPPAGHPLTTQDLDAFMDGFMPLALRRGDIAGSVVIVVKDGQIIFEHGYGFADVATQKPVDPKTTIFRLASISKLFAWTAVMQLAEQHKLDLNADVNPYLDFRIPQAFGKPITMLNLMTHTPGFEDTLKNQDATDPKYLMSLKASLKRWVPTRVFPPGEVPAYSNYGAALAGYIVQRVSGEPFAQYVERHIFQPLQMTHSTFVEPLPTKLAADMSDGYDVASEGAKPFELDPQIPAGALSASGDDMAHFMIAHLANGAYDGTRILAPETAIKMHSPAYQHTPGIPGMAYGFYHDDLNGHDVLTHGGDTQWFHSQLYLILDENVGIFVSQNSAGRDNSDIRAPLFRSFMDRYFPAAPSPAEPTLESARADGGLVAGDYIASRGSFDNFFDITGLISQPAVKVNEDGTLSINFIRDFADNPKKFREVRPFVWREVQGRELVIAKREDGKVTEFATDADPQINSFFKAPWWEEAKVNFPVFATMLALLALTVVFWPIKAILRWHYGAAFPLSGRTAFLYRMTRIVALCDVILYAGMLGFIIYGLSNHDEFLSTQHDWILRVLQIIGLAGTIGVVAAVLNAIEAVRGPSRPWWTKVIEVLVAVACVLSVWYAISEHLLSISLNY